nr:PREDICTED: A disintegrin and metalloproteinase with thrombospondin motifs 7-like [Linepithema humile]
MPLLDNDMEKIRCMILAYVNRIQAAFHHPSLGVTIDISLVHLDIMENQPPQLPVVDLDYVELLNSFCKYAYIQNFPDEHSHHWDFSIYLTGIDLYKYEDVKISPTLRHPIIKRVKNYDLKGGAFESACKKFGSCAIAEFRATSEIISLGLRSSSLAAHEIGHLLGLDHDTDSKQKSGHKYVMSKFHSNENHVAWSEKSRNKIKGLWERKECLQNYKKSKSLSDAYLFDSFIRYDLPGREATAKAQCEVYLRDKNANVVTLHDICETLQCEVPHTNAYYFTGPALPGTYCALGMECRDEECVPVIEPPYNFRDCEDDNWSEWKEDACKNSYCLEGSKGVRDKRRFCKHQNDTTANCIGPYYDVVLCDASSLCSGKRKTVAEFAVTKCAKFTDIMSELELKRGTYCALGMECRDEECVPVIEPPYNFRDCEDDNWSEWKEDACKNSYCLEGSKGVRDKRRFANIRMTQQRIALDHITTWFCAMLLHYVVENARRLPNLLPPNATNSAVSCLNWN